MTQDHLLSSSTYDKLKPVVQIVLPAIATLYFTLAQVWDFPNPEGVVASITAITTFLGVVLGLSSKSFNNSEAKYDGSLDVTGFDEDTGRPNLALTLKKDPSELMPADVKTVRLKAPTLAA